MSISKIIEKLEIAMEELESIQVNLPEDNPDYKAIDDSTTHLVECLKCLDRVKEEYSDEENEEDEEQ